MSGGARNRFDGQQWREELIRKRTKEALAVWPQAERYLHFNEEYKRQTAIYEQERAEKLRAESRKERNAQREKKRSAARLTRKTAHNHNGCSPHGADSHIARLHPPEARTAADESVIPPGNAQ
ncbi:MAG: hypothetical protein V8S92_00710 [Oscillospiraceae bacterium]